MEGGVTPFSSSMAPSGSYILIVVSQPLTEEHKQIILQRLNKGLLSWDVSATGCDLSGLEYAFSSLKERVTENDVLIQHSTESLGVEVLLSPTVRTLKQCVKNLLSTATSHKQLIHAGYTFAGSGSWILENGTFSFEEFLEIFQQADVQNQKRCILNVHCAEEGNWNKTNFAKDIFVKTADIALNPPEKVNHVPGSEHLIKCLDNALITQTLEEMMKPSPLVGNIRFNRPTIYMFPAGQGDCALFGINGFNMLIDGGFHRKPCSWDFVRHLDRLDAVLVTRIGESNVCGMSTLMKRNALNNANPQIGYVFCNIAENKTPTKDENLENKDDLIVSVVREGHNFVQTLNDLKLKPHQCWRDSSIDPFVLYHKVGQGTLEMHVLSPPRDSKEMKMFLSEWNAYKETFSGVKTDLKGLENMIPLSHATSICAILVWRPEDPKDTITRILFPGSAPQNKILEGLDKLKALNILNQPVVTKASLATMTSTKIVSNKIEKSVSRASIPNRNHTASPALSVSSIASRNGDIGGLKKDVKDVKKIVKDVKKDVKREVKKENKEVKKEVKEIKKEIKSEIKKDVKKEIKNDIKKDSLPKKELSKDTKKDTKEVKKVIKKDVKDIKSVNDKKQDMKSAPKKETATANVKTTTELKKTAATKKSTPVKKDAGKPPIAPKSTETKKTVSKVSEPKTTKDVTNKKAADVKAISKTKPKSASTTPKASSTPKTKPVAVPKPGSKMTQAMAASSIVASAVAVTAAAVELNEKKEVIEDTEPEVSEKDAEINVENGEVKDIVVNEKSVEENVSPLPPEALSPTPSESVSLTPSDTLSSAPLETVSPTPPLPNEPISTEEKDVNEIKDIEQDMPYEQETDLTNLGNDTQEDNGITDIEAELAKHQASGDVMSASFIGDKPVDEAEIEELFTKTVVKENESVQLKSDQEFKEFSQHDIAAESENAEEKDVIEEKEIVDKENIEEKEILPKDYVSEKEVPDIREIVEEGIVTVERDDEIVLENEKDNIEQKEITCEKDVDEKDVDEKDIDEGLDVEEKGFDKTHEERFIEKDVDERPIDTEEKYEEKVFNVDEKDIDESDIDEKVVNVEEKDVRDFEKDFDEKDVDEKAFEVKHVEKDFDEKDVDEKAFEVKPVEKDFDEKDVDEKYIDEESDKKDAIDDDSASESEAISEQDKISEKDSGIVHEIVDEKHISTESDAIDVKQDIDDYEEKILYEQSAKDIDDQLAGLSMEGSFCAGMMPSVDQAISSVTEKEDDEIKEKDITDEIDSDLKDHVDVKKDIVEEVFEKKIISETESCLGAETNVTDHDKEHESESNDQITALADNFETQLDDPPTQQDQLGIDLDSNKEQSCEMSGSIHQEYGIPQSEVSLCDSALDEEDKECGDPHFDRLSQIQSMEASFHQEAYESYDHATNIDDLEMQETSVDEPEEIVRKESAVSITLNDENPEAQYTDNWRRKSGTESEDDVDIGKYMCKEQNMDEEKLGVQRDYDSDEEDVVKSPTPHAVVDYEGQLDEAISTMKESDESLEKEEKVDQNVKEVYLTEKQDFDEKDRDSAEEQDIDDGEMIRHPTPPEMKYSEAEMRDPIGQHFITSPSLKAQGSDITEQPLYEEAEDSGSERSASPIVEQPVFGNTAEADFPELVTVSGGTTPSEPQSPKSDVKKFATEAAVMEALSEHDVSESSTHSPSCQDGSTAFDLQASDKSVIEVQSLQEDQVISVVDECSESKHEVHGVNEVNLETNKTDNKDESGSVESAVYDNEENKDDKETPSDEEESSSEDENSESHSKDKSDAMGDKSDFERDDKSDLHNDDKSDHHYDGKPDVVNDNEDDQSDIHDDEQLYRHHDSHMDQDSEVLLQSDTKPDFQELSCHSYDIHSTNQFADEDAIQNRNENSNSNIYEHFASDFRQEGVDTEINLESQSFTECSQPQISYTDDTQKLSERIPCGESMNSDCGNEVFNNRDSEKYPSNESDIVEHYESAYTGAIFESNLQYSTEETIFSKESFGANQTEGLTVANQDYYIDKNEENDDSHNFQANEPYFENCEQVTDIHSFDPPGHESEGKTTSVEVDSEIMTDVLSQEVPSGFGNYNCVSIEQHENQSFADNIDLRESASLHLTDCINTSEIKMAEPQHDNVSQYKENIDIASDVYSENTQITNVANNDQTEMTTLEYTTSEVKAFTSSSTYECSSVTGECNFDQKNTYEECYKTDFMNESDNTNKSVAYGIESAPENFSDNGDYQQLKDNLHSEEHMQSSHDETHFAEPRSEIEVTSYLDQDCNEMLSKASLISEAADVNFNAKENAIQSPEFAAINGKDQVAFSLPASEITTEFIKTELSHEKTIEDATQGIEQESNYLVNNRFHSDSPEDNTMRSDSSPDVPYPSVLPDEFSEMKNAMSVETHSETYIHNTEDYKNNMNFSTADGMSLSSQNHSHNANQNNTYTESSEDEGNSLVHGNVSPYAYTNKAYTREEEDIDGNHIYKEETTEVIKQVEFDGNNLQTLTTTQVSSVMNYSPEYQDIQYSTGANYDFQLEEWGKPMGLPTPPDSSQKTATKKGEKSTVKSKTAVDANGKSHSPSVSSKLSSPLKKPKPKTAKESSSSPVYVDLAYVPQHADPHYCDVEFFKKIRARYYVFSSVNPSKEVLNALLDAKKTWNEDLSVTIIPTYETDTLGYWMAQNQNDLAEYSIDVSPSASRCTVNLQDHQTSCSAYRLEF